MSALRQGRLSLLRKTPRWLATTPGTPATNINNLVQLPSIILRNPLCSHLSAASGTISLTLQRSISSYDFIRPPAYTGIRPPDKTKFQGNWCNSPDQYQEYAKYLDQPVPAHLKEDALPAIEAFVVETWLRSFPCGARLRRLQRDIAHRLLPADQRRRLSFEELVTVVGHLQRRGILKTAEGRSGRMLLYHVDAKITYYKYREESNQSQSGDVSS